MNFMANQASNSNDMTSANGFEFFESPMFVNCPDIGPIGPDNLEAVDEFQLDIVTSEETNIVQGSDMTLVMQAGVEVDFVADGTSVGTTSTSMMGSYQMNIPGSSIPEGAATVMVQTASETIHEIGVAATLADEITPVEETEPPRTEPPATPETTTTSIASGLTLQTTVFDSTAAFSLTYEGEAWVALAISTDGLMVGSQAVIGLPDDNEADPMIYNLNAKDVSGVVPSETQILTESRVVQTNDVTTLTFTVPLDTEGFKVSSDSVIGFLYAYGSGNTLAYHASRGSFQARIG